ncbi:Carboxymuconolactone decarboxylase [Kalmanozyma brasiliensis GHG001]|uniref:Carboxymuconolactone decarboxylase-like domain-containing protein n=1 Tax=Kalmanozyma brasiliensis (strain GHG001) TaxID=1365824 RepID=V5F1K0_KALBG|nr:Carboxymuconolactone decarboxylase [Kalmanozyma brasiliensis GHG001]EST09174.1 Carboxymuconolactone decarboxylase [Kalmanozyma brasiliensis GHG001]
MSTTSLSPLSPIPPELTLDELKSFRAALSPSIRSDLDAWLTILTATVVSCHHGPESIVHLYELALTQTTSSFSADETSRKSASQRIQRLIQEALVKGSVIHGIPPSLDTIFALLTHIRATSPSYLLDASHFARRSSLDKPISSLTASAHEALRRVYKHNLDQILTEKMGDNMEDLKFLTLEINYGFNLACQEVIGWKLTELVVLAALVTQNCRTEVSWHLRGALRAGWSREDVQSVREVAMSLARRLGVRTDKVPDLDEVKEDSND